MGMSDQLREERSFPIDPYRRKTQAFSDPSYTISSNTISSSSDLSSSSSSTTKDDKKSNEIQLQIINKQRTYDKGFYLLFMALDIKVQQEFLAGIEAGDTYGLYTSLKSKYGIITRSETYRYMKELFNIKLTSTEDMSSYFSRATLLGEKLTKAKSIVPVDQFKYFLLNGLPPTYTTHVDMMEMMGLESKSLEELKSLLIDAQFKIRAASNSNGSVNAVNAQLKQKRKGGGKNGKDVVCYKCGKVGHVSTDCTATSLTCNVSGCGSTNHNAAGHAAQSKTATTATTSTATALATLQAALTASNAAIATLRSLSSPITHASF